MRLPFLQMESDLIAHGAAEVAHLAGCPVALALGHIAMVRAWAVSFAGDDAPPDGWVAGEAAGRRIEAAAQWTGERGRLLQALLDAGQVRSEEGGIRVLHLEPYVKAWEVNRTSKERMRKLRERLANNGERTPKFDGQTQTQTQKEATDLPPASQAAPSNELRLEPQEQPRRRKAREEKPTDPRHRPLLEQLVAQGWELGGPRGARAVADLLSRAGETTPAGEAPGEVLRRAGHALQKRRTAPTLFPAVAELWELVTYWQHFAEPFRAPAGRGPAPPSDFEAPRPYVEPAWLDPNFGKE